MQNGSPSILFFSALDFKEKSIQVIRKTPEAYQRSGWDVTYVVARDESRFGSYFYESTIALEGVRVLRSRFPLTWLHDRISHPKLRTLMNKVRILLLPPLLAMRALGSLRGRSFDVIYGYEVHGYLAVRIFRAFAPLFGIKTGPLIARFQGTFFNEFLKGRQLKRIAFNFEHLLALRGSSDLCIMTDDGTEGDEALRKLGSRHRNTKFWVNGVDPLKSDAQAAEAFRLKHQGSPENVLFYTLARLESWKRIDRTLRICAKIRDKGYHSFRLLIAGDGPERTRLEACVREWNLSEHVRFLGALKHSEVSVLTRSAPCFFSMNDSSNVGNPLLEAIRCSRWIFTLNNGATGQWIRHGENGFIYPIETISDEELAERAADDVIRLLGDAELQGRITRGVEELAHRKLWTWDERLGAEVNAVREVIREA